MAKPSATFPFPFGTLPPPADVSTKRKAQAAVSAAQRAASQAPRNQEQLPAQLQQSAGGAGGSVANGLDRLQVGWASSIAD